MFLYFEKLVESLDVIDSYSTAKSFVASQQLTDAIGNNWPATRTPVGKNLLPELFYFKRNTDDNVASSLLNRNLITAMPEIK